VGLGQYDLISCQHLAPLGSRHLRVAPIAAMPSLSLPTMLSTATRGRRFRARRVLLLIRWYVAPRLVARRWYAELSEAPFPGQMRCGLKPCISPQTGHDVQRGERNPVGHDASTDKTDRSRHESRFAPYERSKGWRGLQAASGLDSVGGPHSPPSTTRVLMGDGKSTKLTPDGRPYTASYETGELTGLTGLQGTSASLRSGDDHVGLGGMDVSPVRQFIANAGAPSRRKHVLVPGLLAARLIMASDVTMTLIQLDSVVKHRSLGCPASCSAHHRTRPSAKLVDETRSRCRNAQA